MPCDSAREKEQLNVAIDKFIHKQKEQADYYGFIYYSLDDR